MTQHPTELDPQQLLEQCQIQTSRRGGPGGQHRNKVETAVTLVHEATGVRAQASERRSQSQNRREALRRLRLRLAVEVRTVRDQTPSPLFASRCQGGRIQVSADNDDFASILAEILDVLDVESYDLHNAAGNLGCTYSQLIKLLKREPPAWSALNTRRTELGLATLK